MTPPATVVVFTMTWEAMGDGPCTDTERMEFGLLTWALTVKVTTPRLAGL